MALPHQYPGVTLDLEHYPQHDQPLFPMGAHTNCYGAESELLQIREVAMMILMDKLTDKPNWHEKVHQEDIVAKWRKEALEQPEHDLYRQIIDGKNQDKLPQPRAHLISEKAFDYCIDELRSKAKFFERTKLVFTLDSAENCVIKSDEAIDQALRDSFKAAFDKLRTDQQENIDWHPRSNDMVQDLVHPSMYPFVYGQSNFIMDECVGVADAVTAWAGKGAPVPKTERVVDLGFSRFSYGIGGSEIPPSYWSDTYQWLPANVGFRKDGTAEFTSYINNLRPDNLEYRGIYRTIEKLIDKAIPAWNHCLSEHNPNTERRARQQRLPTDTLSTYPEWEEFNAEVLAENDFELSSDCIWELREDLGIVDSSEEEDDDKSIALEDEEDDMLSPHKAEDKELLRKAIRDKKWEEIRDPVLPEPRGFLGTTYGPSQRLRDDFADRGLQIIVKMASIELTPEKPKLPEGGWHVEGMMNEHICATALYYLDSENVAPTHLSFRMQTSSYQDDLQDSVGQDEYGYLERVFGTALGPSSGATDSCIQNFGSVETREGRLICFPNVRKDPVNFHHRVSPIRLVDPTKPGHRRFIALWLVDPNQRIVSTANVPPQQLDWWTDATLGPGGAAAVLEDGKIQPEILQLLAEKAGLDAAASEELVREKMQQQKQIGGPHNARLPPEIMAMIRDLGATEETGLMGRAEAEEHRLKLMDERSRFHHVSERGWQTNEYSFCEH
ncbi:hypothetical protein F4778DRAFT_783527 [Xylariomycetidae sp. FL2044]|nr:hypothetical protein F4778DRAFT_783527 [Xylariomycetidae sp. FL2044]